MYNPYQYNYQNYQLGAQMSLPNQLPQQQIIQVNGKASVDTMQLAPNSSLLAMDTTAPIVWLCVSDGIGKVTATPYDIVAHKEEPPVNISNVEERLSAIEHKISEMEVRHNAKSNAPKPKSKQNNASGIAD